MDRRDKDDLFIFIRLIGKRILEVGLLASWCVMAWALDEYVFKKFPLEGIQKLMITSSEVMLDASILYQLIRFLFFRRDRYSNSPYTPWWR